MGAGLSQELGGGAGLPGGTNSAFLDEAESLVGLVSASAFRLRVWDRVRRETLEVVRAE